MKFTNIRQEEPTGEWRIEISRKRFVPGLLLVIFITVTFAAFLYALFVPS